MGCRILSDTDNAVLYCSTSDWAFGPVFDRGEEDEDPGERAERFCRWLEDHHGEFELSFLGSRRADPRALTDMGLTDAYAKWYESIEPLGGKPCKHEAIDQYELTDFEMGYATAKATCPTCGIELIGTAYMNGGEVETVEGWEAA